MTRPRTRGAAKAALRILVSALLVVVLVRMAGDDQVLDRMKAMPASAWCAAVLAFVVLHAASAQKWRLFLVLCGAGIPGPTAVRCHFSGLCANLFLPSLVGGDVVRAALAFGPSASREGVVLASLVDRLTDVVALGALAFAGFVLAPSAGRQPGADIAIDPGLVIAGVALAALGLIVVPVLLSRRIRLRSLPRKLRRPSLRMLRAGRALRGRLPAATAGLLLAILLQGSFVVVNIGIGRAMGWDLDPRLWFLLWPLAKIAAMAPVSLGGLGVREAAFAALTVPFGASADLAVAQSLVWQTVLMAGGVLGGVLWLLHGLRSRRKRDSILEPR